MIPGEVLLVPPGRRLRLPGVTPPPRRLRLRHAATAITVAAFVWWLVVYVFSPTVTESTCIGIPDADYPVLDYRGYDGAWLYNGAVIGYTAEEDETCLSPTPIG